MRADKLSTQEWMSDQEVHKRFTRALSGMDASDEAIERVVALTEAQDRAGASRRVAAHSARAARTSGAARHMGGARTRGRIRARTAVAMVAVTALLATGAYAAVSLDFAHLAFGPKGNENVEAYRVVEEDVISPVTGQPKSWVMPSQTWEDVDDEVAERLLGGYVFDVGYTAQSEGYTLTVGQCVMDELGNGVASVTLENPDGIDLIDQGNGSVTLSNDVPVVVEALSQNASFPWLDSRFLIDSEASTSTKLVGAVYFGPFSGKIEGGVTWALAGRGTAAGTSVEAQDSQGSSVYNPAASLSTKTFSDANGSYAQLSPIGMATYPVEFTASPKEVVIRYADGSEYVAYRWGGDDPVENIIMTYVIDGAESQHGSVALFNRLVDVDAVESIVLRGGVGSVAEDGTYEEEAVELVLTAS